MAIDLQKLEQKFNALLDDPNFVTDFEQWLEARNVSQNSSQPPVSGSCQHEFVWLIPDEDDSLDRKCEKCGFVEWHDR